MNNDLIERYIYAVTKRLSRKQREDVAQELRGLIDDMLTERCGNITPTEKDVRVVLTELGTPQELYAQYDEDGKKCLIGQPYYSTYKFVLKVVLLSVAGGLTAVHLIWQIIQPQEIIGALTQWLEYTCEGLVSTFAFVTMLFAYSYHKDVQFTPSFNLEDLPPVPKKKLEISRLDAVIGIGFDVVFLAVFLAAPQMLGMYKGETGEIIPIFNPAAVRGSWLVIVLFSGLGIIREIVKLLEGEYNRKVLLVTLVTDVLSVGLAIWWLTDVNTFNSAFTENILAQIQGESAAVTELFEQFPQFFLAVMILALGLDLVNAIVKYIKK